MTNTAIVTVSSHGVTKKFPNSPDSVDDIVSWLLGANDEDAYAGADWTPDGRTVMTVVTSPADTDEAGEGTPDLTNLKASVRTAYGWENDATNHST